MRYLISWCLTSAIYGRYLLQIQARISAVLFSCFVRFASCTKEVPRCYHKRATTISRLFLAACRV
jgi:hypothetical protein